MTKFNRWALEHMLHELYDNDYTTISLAKLYRLLGRGNRAARTWRELQDAWEELGYEEQIYVQELTGEIILLVLKPVQELRGPDWAKMEANENDE